MANIFDFKKFKRMQDSANHLESIARHIYSCGHSSREELEQDLQTAQNRRNRSYSCKVVSDSVSEEQHKKNEEKQILLDAAKKLKW